MNTAELPMTLSLLCTTVEFEQFLTDTIGYEFSSSMDHLINWKLDRGMCDCAWLAYIPAIDVDILRSTAAREMTDYTAQQQSDTRVDNAIIDALVLLAMLVA